MSGSAQGDLNTTKATVSDVKDKSKPMDASGNKPPAAQLEEDDEFEDFPVEGTFFKTFSKARSAFLCSKSDEHNTQIYGHTRENTALTFHV